MVSSLRRFGQTPYMHDVLLLGPQFRAPNLRDALETAGLHGPVVTITAGWQEREGELGALEEHLGLHARDLRLYERAEAVFAQDGELQAAYRSRQNDLRQLQDLYRVLSREREVRGAGQSQRGEIQGHAGDDLIGGETE